MTNLVEDWLVLGPVKDSFKILGSEIADADAFQFALILEILEYLP